MFKGIEHAVGTNTSGGGGFPDLQVVHVLRADLTDPDIQLYASPRAPSYVAGYQETAGYTTTNFLKNHGLQVAINANQFFLPGSTALPGYWLTEGTAFNASQLLISQGQVVSSQDSSDDPAVLMFATNNTPTFIPTNWPAHSTTGIFTAVAGPYAILVNGVNIGSNYINSGEAIHGLEPRTALGLSQDRRYLYLLVIDGRQSGYSVGAYDWETAAWLLVVGAWDGINLDGGGSTCMAVMDSASHPVQLNRDTASAQSGRQERTVGVHFGIYAQPVPGFFTNVLALPDDTAATITWTTVSPATTQLKYGLTTNLNLTTTLDSALVTNHAVLLTNLSPATGYYFAALGTIGTNQYTSSNLFFITTNYVTTSTLFDFANTWKYMTANLDGVAWTARDYDDSSWTGSGPGLLWVDDRGVNTDIPVVLSTEMPGDPNTGWPFYTYYFRTHFAFTNGVSGVALQLEDYIDDGAVFYLNGTEIYRLRMAAAPTIISNATLANGYACDGNATCPDDFSLSGPRITTNLVVGDNVLAVEVHNYNAQSPDITFGLSAACTVPYISRPTLDLACSNSVVTLSWSQGGYTLQQASAITGAWSNVPGPIISSPFTTNNSGATRFFRLSK